MDILFLRICEIIEKFPKLSGLSGLTAKDLCLKTEKGLLPIKCEKIGDMLKAKDLIIFELDFFEFWLEVEMTLECDSRSLQISFELKVKIDSYIAELKNILIKMGIKSWAKYSQDSEEHLEENDYYLFFNFAINFSDKEGLSIRKEIELDNFHGNNL